MNVTNSLFQKHKLTYLLPLGLALGLIAQWLFIGRPLGISWLIFIAVLLAALITTGRRAGLNPERCNLWLWPALLFFTAMVFLRANAFLTFLNLSATMGLLAFIFYFYTTGVVTELPLSGILVQPWRMAGQTLVNLVPAVAVGVDPLVADHAPRRELTPVLRGGVLALPIVAVFTLLLASADLVFNAHLYRLLAIDNSAIAPLVGRTIFAGLVALVVIGGTATAVLRGLRQSRDDESWLEREARTLPLRLSLSSVETATILSLVSALFLAFVLLQFKYLFGGEANITGAGFTYAEYARRGFLELVLVASLSLALILVLNWLTRRESKHQIKWFNSFSTVLIGLVLLLLLTAFWRMRLYEQAYGYTELRLIVLVFELWLGLLLIWFLITLWRAPQRFAPGLFIAALGFAATLNLINPDALIVRHNLQRYRETGDLDVLYLMGLSNDAVPHLAAAWPEINKDQQALDAYCQYDRRCQDETMGELLGNNLLARHEKMLGDAAWLTWPAYHYARYKAAQALVCFQSPEATAVHLGTVKLSCSRDPS